jgi:hypothetical protein
MRIAAFITNRNAAQGTLAWSTLVFVSIMYFIARACSLVVFSTLTMPTNHTQSRLLKEQQ